jgi:hypothetical protein
MSREESAKEAISQVDQELSELKEFINSKGTKGPLAEDVEEEVVEEEVTEDKEEVVEEKLAESPEDLAKKLEDERYYSARRDQQLGAERAEKAKLEAELLKKKHEVDLDEDAKANDDLVRASLDRIRQEETATAEATKAAEYARNADTNYTEYQKVLKNDTLKVFQQDLESEFEALGATQEERTKNMNASSTWVADTMTKILASKVAELQEKDETSAKTTEDVIKRKESASVVSGGGATTKASVKSFDDMSIDELQDFIAKNKS